MECIYFIICFLLVDDNMMVKSWKKMKEYCKSIGVYLIGNFILLNIIMVCMELMYINLILFWIGIVRDFYEKKE